MEKPDLSEGKCYGLGKNMWPMGRNKGRSTDTQSKDAQEQEVARFCKGTRDKIVCPVKKECLEWAIFAREEHGVWGGMTEAERSYEVKRRKRRAA